MDTSKKSASSASKVSSGKDWFVSHFDTDAVDTPIASASCSCRKPFCFRSSLMLLPSSILCPPGRLDSKLLCKESITECRCKFHKVIFKLFDFFFNRRLNLSPGEHLRGLAYNCVLKTQASHLGSACISALTCSTSGTVHQGQSSGRLAEVVDGSDGSGI